VPRLLGHNSVESILRTVLSSRYCGQLQFNTSSTRNLNATSPFPWSDTDSPRACKWLVAVIGHKAYMSGGQHITGYVHVIDVSQAGTIFFLPRPPGSWNKSVWLYTTAFGLPGLGSADPIICRANVPLPLDPPSQSAPMHRSQDGGSETNKAHPLNLPTPASPGNQASRGKPSPTSARTQRVFVPP
jgi:hypothetical protein